MADPERGQVPLSEQCRGLATKAAETEADLAAKTAQLDALKAYNNKLITTFGELVTCTNEMIEALTDPQQQQKFAALLKRGVMQWPGSRRPPPSAVSGAAAALPGLPMPQRVTRPAAVVGSSAVAVLLQCCMIQQSQTVAARPVGDCASI